MIRHCDGTDLNLTREVYYNEVGKRLVSPWRTNDPATVNVACDCGSTFDDVERMRTRMRHDPVVKKLDDGNHHVCCGECSEAIGITATVKTIVASSASRRWANQLADLHRRRTTT